MRDENGKSVYVPRDMKYQEWKAWQEDGAPSDIEAWRESIKPASNQSRALNASKARDFGELDNHVKTRYGVSLPDDVKTFTFESVRDAIAGIDTVIDEFPEIKNTFTGFTTSKYGIMALGYDGKIHINPGYFTRSHDYLLKAIVNGHPPRS